MWKSGPSWAQRNIGLAVTLKPKRARAGRSNLPPLAFAQHTLALALQGQGKLDEAAALLEHALSLQPNSAEAITNLARLREQQGHVQESFELYHRALDLQPDSAYVHAKRAELLEKAGRVEEAEAILARGLAREPGHPILNLVAARLDRRAGRHAQAVTRLESILNLPAAQESRAEIHLLLGQLHDRLGNTDKALPHLIEGKRRVALATDPNGQSRSRFLARVGTARAWMSDDLATPPLPPSRTGPRFSWSAFHAQAPRCWSRSWTATLACRPWKRNPWPRCWSRRF